MVNEAIEVLFQLARDFGRAPEARAIPQALGPLLGTALHPCAEGRISHMERLGDGVDMVPCHHLTDGLSTAKDPRLCGLLEQGI